MHNLYLAVSFYMVLALLILSGHAAQALPLLNTDDAEIVAAGHCQIELGQNFHRDQESTAGLIPACNLFNQFELALPLFVDNDEQHYAIQVKKTIFSLEQFPMAIAGSVQWQPRQQDQAQNWDFNLPVSIYALEGFQFDANIGLHHEAHDQDLIWGLASTYEINAIHQVSLEFFKADPGKKRAQAVYHYQVLPDQLALYASYGQPLQSDDKPWVGMGLSWVFPFR